MSRKLTETTMSAQLQKFLKTCDPEGMRSVDSESFRDLCQRLNIPSEECDAIFEDLDQDGDGRISFADFSRGFADFLETLEMRGVSKCGGGQDRGVIHEDESTKRHAWTALTSEAERLGKHSDEGKLKWLLGELQVSEQKHLVPYLENAVEELFSNLQQLQDENRQLEDSWTREKLEHEKHLKRMEEELDSQVKEAEMRLRLKAQAEVEDERKNLQSKMDAEMSNLQDHLALFQKVNSWFQTHPSDQRDARLDEIQRRLDEAAQENRKLRMSLLDTQTSIALMRSEFLQLRTMYDEKCRELTSEREKILEVLQEQDHLSLQLNLLHDENRRLLDSHDALRSSVESSPNRSMRESYRAKSGSIIGDYLDSGLNPSILNTSFYEEDEDEDECPLRRARSMDISLASSKRTKANDRRTVRQSMNQSDSGVSTFRDPLEAEENSDDDGSRILSEEETPRPPIQERDRPVSAEKRRKKSKENVLNGEIAERRLKSSTSQDSILDVETFPKRRISDIKKQLGIVENPSSWRRSWSPKSRECSSVEASPLRPTPLPRLSKVNSTSTDPDSELNNNCYEESEENFQPTGPAEQTFKVIFVGDAGVGKSSFALRISKGVFVSHMSSTLGVDFLMRTLRIDGRNVAVQLWDTAGQERFRSITKTYFRKADGVMLLYDCTCEQSFLSVRQWVEDVDKASPQRIPLMIVANKTDLRDNVMQAGNTCITTEQGEKLAKDCDTTFMEASAKDGSNVLYAMANLIRSMSTQQDLQLSASTMHLCDMKSKKSSGCCSK